MSFDKEKITSDVQKLMLRDLRRELTAIKKKLKQHDEANLEIKQDLLKQNESLRSELYELQHPSNSTQENTIEQQAKMIETLKQRVANISKEYNDSHYGKLPPKQNAKISDEMLQRIIKGDYDNRS